MSLIVATLEEDDITLVHRWLGDRTRWDDADVVSRYERAFAAWNGSAHASAFKSGRVALGACLHALALAPGDEVIVPAYTCVVVANAVRRAGLAPVFADIELDTFGIDAGALAARITPRTKAIVIQHLYGLVCRDYEALLALAAARGIAVIEDCAHATGALFRGQRVGTRGSVAFYSSEWSKVLTTGQGGMAVTDDADAAARIVEYQQAVGTPPPTWTERVLTTTLLLHERFHHARWRYALARVRYGSQRIESTTADELRGELPPGYAGALPAPLAALGIQQLAKLDRFAIRRRRGAAHWDAWCDAHGYARPLRVAQSEPVFLRYPVLVEAEKKRDRSWGRRELGFVPGDWFRTHLHPAPGRIEGVPNADAAVARCINFPTVLP